MRLLSMSSFLHASALWSTRCPSCVDHHQPTVPRRNLTGFLNILEACRHHAVEHLVYAHHLQSTASTRRCPTPQTTVWTTPSASCSHQEGERASTRLHPPYDFPTTDCVSLPSTVPKPARHGLLLLRKAITEEGDQGLQRRHVARLHLRRRHHRRTPASSPHRRKRDGDRYKIYNIGNNKPVTLSPSSRPRVLPGKTAERSTC